MGKKLSIISKILYIEIMGDKKYKGIAPITGPMPLHFPAVASGHQYSNRRISCGCCVRRIL